MAEPLRIALWSPETFKWSWRCYSYTAIEDALRDDLGHTVTRYHELPQNLASFPFEDYDEMWIVGHHEAQKSDMVTLVNMARYRKVRLVGWELRPYDAWPGAIGEPLRGLAWLSCDDRYVSDPGAMTRLRTRVDGEVGVVPPGGRTYPTSRTTHPRWRGDVGFIGERQHPRHPFREELYSWLRNSKFAFRHFEGGGTPLSPRELPEATGSIPVWIADTPVATDHRGYLDPVVFDLAAAGACILHPWVEGIDDYFTVGTHIRCFEAGNWAELRGLIAFYAGNDRAAPRMGTKARKHVLAHHSWARRCQQILDDAKGTRNEASKRVAATT